MSYYGALTQPNIYCLVTTSYHIISVAVIILHLLFKDIIHNAAQDSDLDGCYHRSPTCCCLPS